ncbi:MAG: hypothetical protein NTW87_25710 [Planctomycetota bacterium]|nr:hypothetical protein [Planctomycetota bacterium]
MVIVGNAQYAAELARAHFDLEPGITRIVRLLSSNEELPNEPLKLLEVNTNSVGVGIRPIEFAARVEGAAWYPPVVIIEVTPEEYQKIRGNPALLPNGWQLSEEYERPQ